MKNNDFESNQKENDKRKVFMALITLVLTAVILTTASYAWFTQTTTVEIEGIDVNVEATSGIQISVDGVNWYTALTYDQIRGNAYANNKNQVPTVLKPVSTGLDVTGGLLPMYSGKVETINLAPALVATASPTEPTTTDPFAATQVGDYIAFDVFIRSTQDSALYLGTGSDVSHLQVQLGDPDRGLKNASRVAFINMGSAANATEALELTTDTDDAVELWEPNNNEHTMAAILYAINQAKFPSTFTATEVVPSYYGVKAVVPASAQAPLDVNQLGTAPNDQYFAQITPKIATVVGPLGSKQEIFAEGDYEIKTGINKIRIYAWIEGQDVDCEDDASGANIKFSIKFSL